MYCHTGARWLSYFLPEQFVRRLYGIVPVTLNDRPLLNLTYNPKRLVNAANVLSLQVERYLFVEVNIMRQKKYLFDEAVALARLCYDSPDQSADDEQNIAIET